MDTLSDCLLYTSKGAPEIILDNCDSILTTSGVKKLDDATRKQVVDTAREFASQALRVLGIASKPDAVLESAQTGMTFLGLAGMIDPPRPEAKEAIAVCESAVSYTHLILLFNHFVFKSAMPKLEDKFIKEKKS